MKWNSVTRVPCGTIYLYRLKFDELFSLINKRSIEYRYVMSKVVSKLHCLWLKGSVFSRPFVVREKHDVKADSFELKRSPALWKPAASSFIHDNILRFINTIPVEALLVGIWHATVPRSQSFPYFHKCLVQ